jgi:hypothetical protein
MEEEILEYLYENDNKVSKIDIIEFLLTKFPNEDYETRKIIVSVIKSLADQKLINTDLRYTSLILIRGHYRFNNDVCEGQHIKLSDIISSEKPIMAIITRKGRIEVENNKSKKSSINQLTVTGHGNTVNQDSPLENVRISPAVQTIGNSKESKPLRHQY